MKTQDHSSGDYCATLFNLGDGGLIFLQNWRRTPAVASFSYKIGGGGKDLATLLAAVLTWSGYW